MATAAILLSIAPTHADNHGLISWQKEVVCIAISTNAACRDVVSANPSGMKEDYETLGMVLKSVNDHSISDRETEVDISATIPHSQRKSGIEESEYIHALMS